MIHWYALRSVIHEQDIEKKKKVVDAAYDFYIANALYLEKLTRQSFHEAINIVDNYQMYLKMYRDTQEIDAKKQIQKTLTENWDKFHKVSVYIFMEVELEPIKMNDEKVGPLGDTEK